MKDKRMAASGVASTESGEREALATAAYTHSLPTPRKQGHGLNSQNLRCPVCRRSSVLSWGRFGDSRVRCRPCGFTSTRSGLIAARDGAA